MDDIISDEDKGESDIIEECERELRDMENRKNEKRPRESEASSEEGFVTVTRRRPKRLIRSDSVNDHTYNIERNIDVENDITEDFEVCLSSLKVLPKQMALARLLRDEGIGNINKIKYKSPYRVFVQLKDKVQGEKLISNKRIMDLDIRAQFTDQHNICYGIIRGVDLDINDKELLESLSASCEILSIKRMRRINIDHKWVDSESVRISFKSISPPPFIVAYGCKFTVEKYVFPVTQCSRCWRYGHIKKFCTLIKNICPKCGKDHDNCETETFTCPNCHGSHIAIDKECPYFIKEKEIRTIMSEENITYKKALQVYLKNQSPQECIITKEYPANNNTNINDNITQITPKLYSTVLQTKAVIHQVDNSVKENTEARTSHHKGKSTKKKNKTSSVQQQQQIPKTTENEYNNLENTVLSEEEMNAENSEKRREARFSIWNLIFKIRNIVVSEHTFEEKCKFVLGAIIEECKIGFQKILSRVGIVEHLFNLFNG